MSSDYHALCLNHDPAIVIDGEWRSAAEAIDAVRKRTDERLRQHADCDLLVGRYSYPLVEVCCPGGNHAGLLHTGDIWADRDWLRLLYAARQSKDPAVLAATAALNRSCWSPDRIHRLRDELGIERQP